MKKGTLEAKIWLDEEFPGQNFKWQIDMIVFLK